MGEAKRRKALLGDKYYQPDLIKTWVDLVDKAVFMRNANEKQRFTDLVYICFGASLQKTEPGIYLFRFTRESKSNLIKLNPNVVKFESSTPTITELQFVPLDKLSGSAIASTALDGINKIVSQGIDWQNERVFVQQYDFSENTKPIVENKITDAIVMAFGTELIVNSIARNKNKALRSDLSKFMLV